MDLSALHDDEIVAETQRRLDRGTVGWHGLLSTDQANHRDNWHALLEVVYDARNRYPHEFGTMLVRNKALELVDRGGPQTRPFAINTTLHGIEKPEEHQAKMTAEAA